MGIVGGLDIHRAQITFDWADQDTGETRRGEIRPATRERFRAWLDQFAGRPAAFAFEAGTGWRFVAEEVVAAGFEAHLAETTETAALRGRKRRAKTDRTDARHERRLLERGDLPEAWIAPAHLLELRALCRLRQALADERGEWQQRVHATLFHLGAPTPPGGLLTPATRAWLAQLELPALSRHTIDVALCQIDWLDEQLAPLEGWLRAYARHHPACRALIDTHYGVGTLLAPIILAEIGDARRFRNGEAIVRYTGLDVTVHSSDGRRGPGRLAKQGPALLRWALYEAAKLSARPASPHHQLYRRVQQRIDGNRAALSVARKLARSIRHTLVALGDDAVAPIDDTVLPTLAVPAPSRQQAA